ncbi:MAG: UDP-N-acetylmuramate dehydrogenase [Candidatus Pacebacteria bacterium]|nr:UDP-N-acetylmuramate dehydrogenase [Candidatus Paceibacterota bacterium]
MKRHLDLSTVSTLRLGGFTQNWRELKTPEDIENLVKERENLGQPLFIVGGGSNTIFSDGEHQLLVGLMKIKGIEITEQEEWVIIKVGAGENWDELVALTVNNNWAGLEALSAIPGTVGAAPIQNIGAYGAEVKDTIMAVKVYDISAHQFITLSNTDCKFSYRDSIFKQNPSKFIVTEVTFKLKKITGSPTLPAIREEIIKTRWGKLPKPEELPNNGSFFKNPFVSEEQLKTLVKSYPTIPHFPAENNKIKIPAGWLVDQAGFKGLRHGAIGTYDKNALVIVNHGGATYDELEKFIKEIQTTVFTKFGIKLEPEVNIITN